MQQLLDQKYCIRGCQYFNDTHPLLNLERPKRPVGQSSIGQEQCCSKQSPKTEFPMVLAAIENMSFDGAQQMNSHRVESTS